MTNHIRQAEDAAAAKVAALIAMPMPEPHDSDCATHNEPAYQNGPCDCSVAIEVPLMTEPFNSQFHRCPEWRDERYTFCDVAILIVCGGLIAIVAAVACVIAPLFRHKWFRNITTFEQTQDEWERDAI